MKHLCALLLFAATFQTLTVAAVRQNFGKSNITENSSDGFYCGTISFAAPFPSGSTVRIFLSLDRPGNGNEAAVAMVTSTTENSFSACVMEPAKPTGEMTLNWFALSENSLPSGTLSGSVPFTVFTSGSLCKIVIFTNAFDNPPKVFISARHVDRTSRKDAMALWAENVTESQFKVCLREMMSFSGAHNNLHVDWMALGNTFSANMTDLDKIVFPNTAQPSLENNYAYCQVQNFSRPFYSPPTVLVSANRKQGLQSSLSDQSIVSWIKDIGITTFEICLKDLPGISGRHEPITVDFAAVGDLDPCLEITCEKFSVCRAFGPYDARCVCVTDCPSVEQNVCASNGKSFKNLCLFQLEVCRTKANYSYYHHGSCQGFPVKRGRRHVSQVPQWSNSHCQAVQFEPLTYYPDKPVHVQISVSHVNDTGRVHDAAVSWVEKVSEKNFTFCVMESGRNEGPPHGFATVEWMAYQGAPSGGLAGVVSIPEWWTGTKCQNVDMLVGNFSSTPTVLVTAEHHRQSLKHDAASLWLEDVSTSSFKVCLRELQNFDGPHQDIFINWLAFETLEQPLFTEHGVSDFPHSSQDPFPGTNYAQCRDVFLAKNYSAPPTVLVSPKHSSSGRNIDPQHNGISAWIEAVTSSYFKVCFKELYTSNGYDAVTVNHVVLKEICDPGWMYYRGYCYKRVASCQAWTNASTICTQQSSNLVGIDSAEEDVFIQHLHHGRPSWIGLNDRANEGVFLWTDGFPVIYTHWGPGLSAPYSEDEDCVETTGRDAQYYWETTSCDNCRNFSCKKDYDECSQNVYQCDPNADCINAVGSYTCQCHTGYTGNGFTCTDFDECSNNAYSCDRNADCINTVGSYTCLCRSGYTGDAVTCTDIDECSRSPCSSNAYCNNTAGSYMCRCSSGYTGDGYTCSDFDECSNNAYSCDRNADCINTVGSYTCRCRSGYTGDIVTCTDINECSRSPCSSNAYCNNTAGSYICRCSSGYTGDGFTCSDINECSRSPCSSNAFCSNTAGSYICRCSSGYTGDGHTCSVVNCGYPGSPTGGYNSGSSYTYGSTVCFYCYWSSSSRYTTTCQANGQWSGPHPPKCYSDGKSIRLAGSAKRSEGRVEIYHPSYGWGTVCDDGWGTSDANVVCRQLGYNRARRAYGTAHYGQGSGSILLDDVNCGGSESRLWDCSHNGWNNHDCSHGEDAGVQCE